jgi:hypothetical protein
VQTWYSSLAPGRSSKTCCKWFCILDGDLAFIPYLKDGVTLTMPSITSSQEHGVRWHPAAIAGYVYRPHILLVTSKTVNRFAISRRALCTTSLTRTTMSPCCYLCTAPPAVTVLFLTSRLLGRSRYDSLHVCIFFYHRRPLWRIIFLYCTCLYYFA